MFCIKLKLVFLQCYKTKNLFFCNQLNQLNILHNLRYILEKKNSNTKTGSFVNNY